MTDAYTHPTDQLYYSCRGIPLLATQTLDKPILTLENYEKWYEIFLLHPDGRVTAVDLDDDLIRQVCGDGDPTAFYQQHNFHPKLLHSLAIYLDAYVHIPSMEIAIGRWVLEIDPGLDR